MTRTLRVALKQAREARTSERSMAQILADLIDQSLDADEFEQIKLLQNAERLAGQMGNKVLAKKLGNAAGLYRKAAADGEKAHRLVTQAHNEAKQMMRKP